MLKTPYKTLYRVHNIDEALDFDIKKTKTDFLLYLTDVYDVLLSVRNRELDMPPLKTLVDLRVKCTCYFLEHYHALYKPIPGVMLGWTTSMLLFLIILTLVHLQYEGGDLYLSESNMAYVKANRLRLYQDPDPDTWCFATYVSMLDVLALRWKRLTPCSDLTEVLETLWRVCAKFTLSIHSKVLLNVEDYNEEVKGKADHARLSEKAIIITMSRFYWFHSACNYFQRWPKGMLSAPAIENTNWAKFIKKERRHFVTRRFRDAILAFLWDKIILYGDKEVAGHSQLGEEVSAMTCLYQRFPAGFLNKLQKLITYEEYEDIVKFEPIRDWVHLVMIAQHFVNTYDLKFLNYFFVSEEKMHKHVQAVERSVVPLILYRFAGFDVFYKGKVYSHPQSRRIEHAFVLWCHTIRSKCNCKAFAMDFTAVCEALLDMEIVVDNTRKIEGMFELEDD